MKLNIARRGNPIKIAKKFIAAHLLGALDINILKSYKHTNLSVSIFSNKQHFVIYGDSAY